MKKTSILVLSLIAYLVIATANKSEAQGQAPDITINKPTGRILKAYLAFQKYLDSEHSWANYKKLVLDPWPEMQAVHKTQLTWGTIDSAGFPEEVKNYNKEDFQKYFTEYDDRSLNVLYDSVLKQENEILKPLSNKPVDLCMFLPYGGCFIIPDKEKCTIYISLLIDPADAEKIMVHEYAHNLHIQRRPDEPFSCKREIVSEGMAVYLTTLVLKDKGIFNAIPFMPESSVKWCFDNEQAIKDSIRTELGDTTYTCLRKFIADGSVSSPPKGFVEKTGFFAGYRIIDACIKKGMTVEEVCSLDSDKVIAKSGYFK